VRFSASRKAVQTVAGKRLQRDLERMVASIESAAKRNPAAAGRRADSLIAIALGLQDTLPARTRISIADAVFADAAKNDLPHQWERKENYRCDGQGNCTVEADDWICYRDTSGGNCTEHRRP
jgi:hypothetical protein